MRLGRAVATEHALSRSRSARPALPPGRSAPPPPPPRAASPPGPAPSHPQPGVAGHQAHAQLRRRRPQLVQPGHPRRAHLPIPASVIQARDQSASSARQPSLVANSVTARAHRRCAGRQDEGIVRPLVPCRRSAGRRARLSGNAQAPAGSHGDARTGPGWWRPGRRAGRPGPGASWTVRTRAASASHTSSRPDRPSPMPMISFITSVACSVPITPVTAPRMPASAAARHQARRRRRGVQAAVARPARMGLEGGQLAIEAQHRGGHQRAPGQHAGVGDQEARREVVAAVAHQVIGANQRHDIVRRSAGWHAARRPRRG